MTTKLNIDCVKCPSLAYWLLSAALLVASGCGGGSGSVSTPKPSPTAASLPPEVSNRTYQTELTNSRNTCGFKDIAPVEKFIVPVRAANGSYTVTGLLDTTVPATVSTGNVLSVKKPITVTGGVITVSTSWTFADQHSFQGSTVYEITPTTGNSCAYTFDTAGSHAIPKLASSPPPISINPAAPAVTRPPIANPHHGTGWPGHASTADCVQNANAAELGIPEFTVHIGPAWFYEWPIPNEGFTITNGGILDGSVGSNGPLVGGQWLEYWGISWQESTGAFAYSYLLASQSGWGGTGQGSIWRWEPISPNPTEAEKIECSQHPFDQESGFVCHWADARPEIDGQGIFTGGSTIVAAFVPGARGRNWWGAYYYWGPISNSTIIPPEGLWHWGDWNEGTGLPITCGDIISH